MSIKKRYSVRKKNKEYGPYVVGKMAYNALVPGPKSFFNPIALRMAKTVWSAVG